MSSPQTKSSAAKTKWEEQAASATCTLHTAVHYFSHRGKKLLSKRWVLLAVLLAVTVTMFPRGCVSVDFGCKLEKSSKKISLGFTSTHYKYYYTENTDGADMFKTWVILWILFNSFLRYKNVNQKRHAWWTWLRLWGPEGYSCASWQRSAWLQDTNCAAGSSRDGGLCGEWIRWRCEIRRSQLGMIQLPSGSGDVYFYLIISKSTWSRATAQV